MSRVLSYDRELTTYTDIYCESVIKTDKLQKIITSAAITIIIIINIRQY